MKYIILINNILIYFINKSAGVGHGKAFIRFLYQKMFHKFFFTADRRPTVCFLAWACLGLQLPGINPPISPALVIKGGPVTVNDDDANANEEWGKDDVSYGKSIISVPFYFLQFLCITTEI